uniref:Uncharacterized protein n=1 Tax=Guillardia theta (strain CCMP2712) TaxID=905079 RepID=A0A0C3TLG1_GUITC
MEDGLGGLTSCLNVTVESKGSGVQHLLPGGSNKLGMDQAKANGQASAGRAGAPKTQHADVPNGVNVSLNDLSGLASFLGSNNVQASQPVMNQFPAMAASNVASNLPAGSNMLHNISANSAAARPDSVAQAQFAPMQINPFQQLQARAAGIQANLQAHIEGVNVASKLANQLQGIQQQLETAKARLQQQLEVTNRSMLLVPNRGSTQGPSYSGTSELYNNSL